MNAQLLAGRKGCFVLQIDLKLSAPDRKLCG
jgi:hypothetical protein